MNKLTQIFPGILKTFVECPKKFEYKYIEKINLPTPASYFEKGKKIHALANYYLQGQDISKLIEALNFEEKETFEKLCGNEFFQKSYVNSEYNLSAKIGNFWVSGRLDALMKSDDEYFILDYKTGSVPRNYKYDFQTILYLLMADKVLNGEYSKLSFVYIDLKNDQNFVVEFNDELKKEYENIVLKTCAEIAKCTTFDCVKSEKCVFCEYSKLCQG